MIITPLNNIITSNITNNNINNDTKINPAKSFKELMTKALGEVNDLQINANKAVMNMIADPKQVNIHEVTALLSQAEMALSMTKTITDRVIHAYREITNLR